MIVRPCACLIPRAFSFQRRREAAEKAEDRRYHREMMAVREAGMAAEAQKQRERHHARMQLAEEMREQRESRAMSRILVKVSSMCVRPTH